MFDSNNILSFLGLPENDVSSYHIVKDTDGISFIDIVLKKYSGLCPNCFSNRIKIKEKIINIKKNSIILKEKMYIRIEKRRYLCKDCKKTFTQQFNITDDHRNISSKTIDKAKLMLLDLLSMEYIANQLDVSRQTIINILDSLPSPQRLPFRDVICLDEFHFKNSNSKAGKYPCVISSPFIKEIIDIVESRRKAYLFEYFERIPLKERNNVKFFITDMNETYRTVKRCFFRNAVHIVDHFHVVKLFTETIQEIRTKIMKDSKESNSKAYKYLKKNWRLFLKSRYDLKDEIRVNKRTGVVHYILDDIDAVLNKYNNLFEAYWAKEEFCNTMVKLHEYEETKSYIEFFINKFQNSIYKEINNLASSLINWKNEIINAYAKNVYGFALTNAIAESNNNYIKKLISVGYSYTNFGRFRKRILYMSSNRKDS